MHTYQANKTERWQRWHNVQSKESAAVPAAAQHRERELIIQRQKCSLALRRIAAITSAAGVQWPTVAQVSCECVHAAVLAPDAAAEAFDVLVREM